MQLSCPKCGTHDVRVSHRRGLLEQIKGLVGIYPLRCRRCKERWSTSTWEAGAWKYARCPKCYRQQLTTWNETFYNPARKVRILLTLGAHRHRCAACRCNFASFKPRKEKFEWRHQERTAVEPEPNDEVRRNEVPAGASAHQKDIEPAP